MNRTVSVDSTYKGQFLRLIVQPDSSVVPLFHSPFSLLNGLYLKTFGSELMISFCWRRARNLANAFHLWVTSSVTVKRGMTVGRMVLRKVVSGNHIASQTLPDVSDLDLVLWVWNECWVTG